MLANTIFFFVVEAMVMVLHAFSEGQLKPGQEQGSHKVPASSAKIRMQSPASDLVPSCFPAKGAKIGPCRCSWVTSGPGLSLVGSEKPCPGIRLEETV